MESFLQEYLQESRESVRCLVREKKIYEIENTISDRSDINMKELATFYHLCGNYKFYQYAPNLPIGLMRGQHRGAVLPYHNAVAFFQRFMEQNPSERQKCYHELRHLLPYVLSCSGFVFGTSFYFDGPYCLHPCDLDFIDLGSTGLDDREEVYANVLRSQAELRIGYSFSQEKTFYSKIVFNLSRQKEQIECWLKEAKDEKTNKSPGRDNYPALWEGSIKRAEEMFWDFLGLYEQYCISQVNGKDLYRLGQIREDIGTLKEAARTVFKMERMLRRLESIIKIQNRNENIIAKKDWLKDFRAELTSSDMQTGISAIIEIMPGPQKAPELYDYITRWKAFSTRKLKIYPILNEESPIYKFGKQEGKELRWYRKSGIAPIMDWLYRGSRNNSIRKVMPFYLLDLFSNDWKPLRPFKRRPYYFHPDKLKFQGEISFCLHPNVIRKQESHYTLYQAILGWCHRYFEGEWDRSLCNALYTFYRRHLVYQQPSAETNFLSNDFSILKDALWKMFNMPPSIFPQRTEMGISANEFLDFYYYNTTPDVKAVRKALQTIITDEDAAQYKELAFLDPCGFGYSFHPSEWFNKIENWLSEIVRRNATVLKYVDSTNPNAAVHQAQVDLAIQFICCQKIQETMTQDVLRFCKQVFSPDCQ